MSAKISVDIATQIMRDGGLEPLEEYIDSHKPWKSKCLICHSIVTPNLKSIKARGSKRKGCKNCAPNAKKTHDQTEQIMLSAQLQPLEKYVNSKAPWKCKCLKCGKTVFPMFNSIQQGQGGCKFCSPSAKIIESEARQLFQANQLEPIVPFESANKPWKSRCKQCNREVTPSYSNIKNGHSGCKYCVGNIVDLEKVSRVFLDNNLEPLEPYKSANHPWKSIHKTCGKIVYPRFNTVQQGSSGCMYCGGNAPIDPKFATEFFKSKNLLPLEDFGSVNAKWRSIHLLCNREVSPRFADVYYSARSGCGYCAGTYVDPEEAKLFYESLGFQPLAEYKTSGEPWSAIHLKCGKKVSPTYNSIQQGGGCKYCATNYIKLDEPAFIYLITNPDLNSHKIGISGLNSNTDRLKKHSKHKWATFKTLNLKTGEIAFELEQKILIWLRNDLCLPPYVLPEQMPQGGFSETVDANEIELLSIWGKVLEFTKSNDLL
jgi:hypothetical protein